MERKLLAIRITIATVLSFAVFSVYAHVAYAGENLKGWTVYGVMEVKSGNDGSPENLGMSAMLGGVGIQRAIRHSILKSISIEALTGTARGEWEDKQWTTDPFTGQTTLVHHERGTDTGSASKLRLNVHADLKRWSDGRGIIANAGYEHFRLGTATINTATIRIGYQF